MRLRGSGEGHGRKRGRADSADRAIPIYTGKPVATSSDVRIVQEALNITEIDVQSWIESLELDQLEDIN